MTKRLAPSAFSNATDRVIRWATDHPKIVLIIVAVITAVAIAFIPLLRVDVDFANYLNRKDPAVIAADDAKERFGSQIRIIVAIEDARGVFRPETLALVERLERAFKDLPEVEDMDGPLSAQVIRGSETAIQIRSAAPNGKAPQTPEDIATYRELVLSDAILNNYVVSSTEKAFAIYLKPNDDVDMVSFAASVEDVVRAHETEGISFAITGVPYVNLTLQRSMKQDLGLFLPLVILIIIGVLFVSFRWTWGVLIPFAVVSLSVLWILGAMAISQVPITVVSFILPVLLMAIGIADGIHVLSRYHEALRDHSDKRLAILDTMSAMKRPVILTSLTTAIGFLSLLYAYMIPQRTFGLFTAIGILIAMILSLVLIPAILRLIKPPVSKKSAQHRLMGKMLGTLVRRAIRYRWAILGGTLVLSLVFAAGIPLLQIETSQRAYLGEGHPAVLAMDRLDELFSGSNQVMVVIDTGHRDGMKNPAILKEIVALEAFLESRGVKKTMSLANVVREMNQRFHADDPAFYAIPDDQPMIAQLLLLFSFQGGSLGSLALSDFSAGEVMGFHALQTGKEQIALVADVTTYLDEHFDGATVQMAGPTRIQASMFSSIARSQLTSLLTSIVAAGVIVILLMRSFSMGIVSMIPLLFTVLFNFGVMAFAGKSLDIATLMISSITIGIGIDYGIHFIERYREELTRTPSQSLALIQSAQTAGTGIVYNALALALGFGIMMLSAFQGLHNFGLLVAMTMVVSAMSAFAVIPALLASRKQRT
ncbi:MMPL family transporter [Candidatus Bipolaricaulota bacterium]|nr:MMPL family transporter [Candidatus Bipolaricaulota bacterium]